VKICIITANLPPVRCGVGDYTVQLANTLADRGDEGVVITGRDQAPAVPGARLAVRNELPSWGWNGMPHLWRAVRRERPDVVLLQWVPFLYSRTGTSLALPVALAALALAGVRLQIMVHEPWVRFIRWSFFITGPVQRLALGLMVTAAERTCVSIEPWARMLRARLPWKRSAIHWVPVGSNIPVGSSDGRAIRLAAGIPEGAPLLGVFSLFGAAKGYSLIEAAWRGASSRPDQPFVVLIGASADEAGEHLPEIAAHPRCRTTGYLSADDVSRWLCAVDVLLAPFEDGVSSRRTSVIAALAHGVPVVTTRGRNTDPLFTDSPLRVSAAETGAFTRETLALLDAGAERVALGAASRAFCDRHFSWPAIAWQLLPPGSPAAAIEAVP